MKRVSTVILTRERSKHDFDLLMSLCHNSKNLYNASLYVVKQAFLGTPDNIPEYADIIVKGRFIREFDLTIRDADLGRPADRGSVADPVPYIKDMNAKETRLTA